MRIIAGKHRSRILKSLDGMNTRPMMDSMKESVFNTIGPYLDEEVILDLFGGSGALSLEAISRGAKEAYVFDINKDAIRIITENTIALHEEDNMKIFQMPYQDALKRFSSSQFDLIFLDPPYRMNINN
ncbi:MAG: RsmD family RNA methyltransferase, partial [Bacilli bacterium]